MSRMIKASEFKAKCLALLDEVERTRDRRDYQAAAGRSRNLIAALIDDGGNRSRFKRRIDILAIAALTTCAMTASAVS